MPDLLRALGAAIAAFALALTGGPGGARRVQYAALPWRRTADGDVEVLLITSRRRGHWLVPKGWPAAGLSPPASAAREAFEEAGVKGRPDPRRLGGYVYAKAGSRGRPIHVEVFPLEVTEELDAWPEQSQRERRWAPPNLAAELVKQAELGRLIRSFAPAPSLTARV